MPAQPSPCYSRFVRPLPLAYCLNCNGARPSAGSLHCRWAALWFTGFAALAHIAFAQLRALPLRNQLSLLGAGPRAPVPRGMCGPYCCGLYAAAPLALPPVGTCCAGPRPAATYRVGALRLAAQPANRKRLGLLCATVLSKSGHVQATTASFAEFGHRRPCCYSVPPCLPCNHINKVC